MAKSLPASAVQNPLAGDPVLPLATQIVVAYLQQNAVPQSHVPQVIETVVRALNGLKAGGAIEREPAVPIKRSVTDEYIICLEDGRKLRMLKRHLRTAYNMSPEQYRRKWGLPADYPMVAPAYARARSSYAKQAGLGKRKKASPRARTVERARAER